MSRQSLNAIARITVPTFAVVAIIALALVMLFSVGGPLESRLTAAEQDAAERARIEAEYYNGVATNAMKPHRLLEERGITADTLACAGVAAGRVESIFQTIESHFVDDNNAYRDAYAAATRLRVEKKELFDAIRSGDRSSENMSRRATIEDDLAAAEATIGSLDTALNTTIRQAIGTPASDLITTINTNIRQGIPRSLSATTMTDQQRQELREALQMEEIAQHTNETLGLPYSTTLSAHRNDADNVTLNSNYDSLGNAVRNAWEAAAGQR